MKSTHDHADAGQTTESSACSKDQQATETKPFVPQRVFISYGHDQHASLALRLRDDLIARGHEAWFDVDRLKPGYDFELGIEKGLQWVAANKPNAVVLLLLTPHSVRRPDGYCLNEVSQALRLGLKIIPLMVADSEPPLSICRIQWLDMRACIPISQKEAVYCPLLQRLFEALEENHLDFEGTQQRLLKALNPLPFEADVLKHLPKFTGRAWVFETLDEWLAEIPPKERVFLILGSPGVGKTALSVWLANKRLEIAALHLCAFEHQQKSDPRNVVTSIAYQLSTQLPDYATALAMQDLDAIPGWDAATLFDNLIVQPLSSLPTPDRQMIILIDALNEATRDDYNALASFIAAQFGKTPEWLRLIVTSQPLREVTGPLQGLQAFVLDTDTDENSKDMRAYLERELADKLAECPRPEAVVEAIVQRSEGVFLYAERVCEDVRKGALSLDRLDEFPKGLGALYMQFFDRLVYDRNRPCPGPDRDRYKREFREPLRAILAAREPLPLPLLQAVWNWSDEDLQDFLASLGALFVKVTTDDGEAVKPYHSTIGDWLADEDKAGPYFVSPAEGNKVLGDVCQRSWQAPPKGSERYILRHAVTHLMQAGRHAEALALLTRREFVARACQRHLTEHLVADLHGFLAAVAEVQERDAVATQVFETLVGALDDQPESAWDYLRFALNRCYGEFAVWPNSLKYVLETSDSVSAQFFLADTHDMEERYTEAEQLYHAIADRERDRDDTTYFKACVKWAMVTYQMAEAKLTAGELSQPRMGEYQGALDILDNVLSVSNASERFANNFWRALYHRGVIYRHIHCYGKAWEDLSKVRREMEPEQRFRTALYQMGLVELAMGRLDEAEELFYECLEERKARHALHRAAYEYRGLGELHALRGRTDEAREAFGKAAEISRRSGNRRYLARVEASITACLRIPEHVLNARPERISVPDLISTFGMSSSTHLRSAFRVVAARRLSYLNRYRETGGLFASQLVRSDVAHRDGDWHATVVVLLFDEDGNLAVQRRGERRAHGLWDVSVAGHCDAFDSPVSAAVRETIEELGVVIDADRLQQIGSGHILRKMGSPGQAADKFDGAKCFRYPSQRLNNEYVTAFVVRVSNAERQAVNTSEPRTATAIRWMPLATAVQEATSNPQSYASGFRQFLHAETLTAIRAAFESTGARHHRDSDDI
jgi:8-oxo-dGTP pyrophosphatase MutT (NUDIX family)/tetratricopeptide (TPR) repeat protein